MKKIIRVQPRYTMILWAIIFLACLSLAFIGEVLGWDSSGAAPIFWYCLMGICSLISLTILFYYLQFAVIDDDGITIRGMFYQIIKLKWEEIATISCERIITYDNRTSVFLSWLVIKLDSFEYVNGRAGRNKRNKSPWCIIATKHNMEIISQYFKITDKK